MNTKVRLARRITLLTVVAALFSVLAYGVGWAVRDDSLPWQDSANDAAPRKEHTGTPTPREQPTDPSAHAPNGSPTDSPSATPSDTATDEPTDGTTPTPTPEPTPTETAGPALLSPGDDGAKVRDLQARLKQIDWFSGEVTDHYGKVTTEAVRGFQAKRGIAVTGAVDQRTLDLLHGMTHRPTEAELTNQPPPGGNTNTPGALDARCKVGRVLCIDKSTRTLRWVVDGQVRKTVDVRFGSSELPTREGVFAIQRKSRDHVSTLYHTAMPFAMFFSGGQAVHYSSDFAARGYSGASHGCVNVRDRAAVAWLFDQVQVGDKVVIYWS